MKNWVKIFVAVGCVCLSFSSAFADEVIHGINVDKIFAESDWNSKEDIRNVINDYTLLLEYQKEFDACPDLLPDVLACHDKVAEKIVTNLYVYPEDNLQDYKNLKKALSGAYGMKNCRTKYTGPGGEICRVDTMSDVDDILTKYIQELLDTTKENLMHFYQMLKEYK